MTHLDLHLQELIQQIDMVENQLIALEEKKKELRNEVTKLISGFSRNYFVQIPSKGNIRLELRQKLTRHYREDILKARLGDRYAFLLNLDPKRIRPYLDEVLRLVNPILPQIGKVDTTRIEWAVTQQLIHVSELRDTCTVKSKNVLYIYGLKSKQSSDASLLVEE